MDAVHRASVDGLVNQIFTVAALREYASLASEVVIHDERVARHQSAILAPDARLLVHVGHAGEHRLASLVHLERLRGRKLRRRLLRT